MLAITLALPNVSVNDSMIKKVTLKWQVEQRHSHSVGLIWCESNPVYLDKAWARAREPEMDIFNVKFLHWVGGVV